VGRLQEKRTCASRKSFLWNAAAKRSDDAATALWLGTRKEINRPLLKAIRASSPEHYAHLCLSETRLVDSQSVSFRAPIPTGLRLKAQGCEERATLGKGTKRESTPTGLRLLCDGSTQPRRRCGHPSEPRSAALSPDPSGLDDAIPGFEDVYSVQVAAALCRRTPWRSA